jgi:hypothetical protein
MQIADTSTILEGKFTAILLAVTKKTALAVTGLTRSSDPGRLIENQTNTVSIGLMIMHPRNNLST